MYSGECIQCCLAKSKEADSTLSKVARPVCRDARLRKSPGFLVRFFLTFFINTCLGTRLYGLHTACRHKLEHAALVLVFLPSRMMLRRRISDESIKVPPCVLTILDECH